MLIISVITFFASFLILFIIGFLFFRNQSIKFSKENDYLKKLLAWKKNIKNPKFYLKKKIKS